MNSKLIVILLFSFSVSSCGVKSSPIHPKGTDLPVYIDQVLEETDQTTNKDKKKESKK